MQNDVTIVLEIIVTGAWTLVDFKETFSGDLMHSLRIILNDNVPYTLKVWEEIRGTSETSH